MVSLLTKLSSFEFDGLHPEWMQNSATVFWSGPCSGGVEFSSDDSKEALEGTMIAAGVFPYVPVLEVMERKHQEN